MEKKEHAGFFGEIKSIKQRSYEIIIDGKKRLKGKMSYPDSPNFSNYDKIFNKSSLITDFIALYNEKIHWKQNYIYNEKQNLLKKSRYFPNGEMMSENIFSYDSNDKLIEENYYFKLSHKTRKTFEFDKKGRLVKENIINSTSSKFNRTRTFQYDNDENYNIVICKDFTADGFKKNEFISKYDKDNNKIEEIYHNPESLSKIFYKYDKFGNMIEEKWENHNPTKYEYSFDKMNNWIEKIVLKSNQPTHIIHREIGYW